MKCHIFSFLISAIILVFGTGCSLLKASCTPNLALDASGLEEIKRYKDCEATVTGFVYSTYVPKSGKVMFINMGSSDYRRAFTAVIFSKNFENFKQAGINLDKYEGQTISVRGTIGEHEGRPQIIVNSPTQVSSGKD